MCICVDLNCCRCSCKLKLCAGCVGGCALEGATHSILISAAAVRLLHPLRSVWPSDATRNLPLH